ncbi:GNAT family N-acetyltransferase [Nonomuraea sp. NPDC050478]|uniref:GNAT family N-acetyltransferase n=1 Tax=unclassified Nonomuraea TaxID=2593643 RepID=UPI0016504035|nr:GNAT family N-acetyltransferase [Nonomuraea sp. C10]
MSGHSRVTVRRVRADDAEEFVALSGASRSLHHGWVSPPTSAEAFEDYVGRFDGVTAVGLVVCVSDTGRLAGFVNLRGIVRGDEHRATIGFGGFAATAGRGYMRDGVRLGLGYAFTLLALDRVEADIQHGNEACLKLAAEVGFQRDRATVTRIHVGGLWRDHER